MPPTIKEIPRSLRKGSTTFFKEWRKRVRGIYLHSSFYQIVNENKEDHSDYASTITLSRITNFNSFDCKEPLIFVKEVNIRRCN